jgi:hypothetical protein
MFHKKFHQKHAMWTLVKNKWLKLKLEYVEDYNSKKCFRELKMKVSILRWTKNIFNTL